MLTVRISSFSYIYNGIPKDNTDNGGGFVFDCRFIYNPGRNPELMLLTGKNNLVAKFLDADKEMQNFLTDCYRIIDAAIDNYLKRKFTNLMVNFGCTGGRHRSVYAAENLYTYLQSKYQGKVKVELHHINIS